MESLFSISYSRDFLGLLWSITTESTEKTALIPLRRDRRLVQSLFMVCSHLYKNLLFLIRKDRCMNSIDRSQICKIYQGISAGLCRSFPDIPRKTFGFVSYGHSQHQRSFRCFVKKPLTVLYQKGNHLCRFTPPKIKFDYNDQIDDFPLRNSEINVECDSVKDHWDVLCMGYSVLPSSRSLKIIGELPTIISSDNSPERLTINKHSQVITKDYASDSEVEREKYYYWRYTLATILNVKNILKLIKLFVNRPIIHFHISVEPKEFEFVIKLLSPLTFQNSERGLGYFQTLQISYHRITEVNEETLLNMVTMFPMLSCLTGMWSPKVSVIEKIFGEYIWHPSLFRDEIECETDLLVSSLIDKLELNYEKCPFLITEEDHNELLQFYLNW